MEDEYSVNTEPIDKLKQKKNIKKNVIDKWSLTRFIYTSIYIYMIKENIYY